MEEQPIDRLLGVLEHFSSRPEMYVRPVEVTTVQSYLWGFAAGYSMAGVPCSWPQFLSLMEAATESRGWEFSTGLTVEEQMRAKGINDALIIQELIAIHTHALRLATNSSENDPGREAGG